MINISKLVSTIVRESDELESNKNFDESLGDKLRYRSNKPEEQPVVVWNTTNDCNLNCQHCYASTTEKTDKDELSTEEAKEMIDQFADMGVPVLLFSGGEPFLRSDLFELGEYTANRGIRPVLSTNGTLINRQKAREAKAAGFSYIGVSLDGMEKENDEFRGRKGSCKEAVKGMRNSLDVGLKTGLRFTLTSVNSSSLPKILDFVERENLNRFCLYHLVYAGKAGRNMDLRHSEKRKLLRKFFAWSASLMRQGEDIEVLSVGNYADAPFLYMYSKRKSWIETDHISELLNAHRGEGTGESIACVDAEGNVHPNQFWRSLNLGNIKEEAFSEIWLEDLHPVLKGLRNRRDYLSDRCSGCKYLYICGGGSRVRAKAVSGDIWGEDPGCYLTEEEINGTS